MAEKVVTIADIPGTETPVAENVPQFILGSKDACIRTTSHSRYHPIIPRHYTMGWRTDMVNRELIRKNADGSLPNFEHDDHLFFNHREQMSYNVEDPGKVMGKYSIPPRAELLNPPKHHPSYRYKSSLMTRKA